MRSTQEVVILSVRCQSTRHPFGVRMEERERNQWEGTWAFKLKEGAAQREGYSSQINGSFWLSDCYPGCPYCSAGSFFLCNCGTLGCWDTESRVVTCPGCENRVPLGDNIKSLSVGHDA